MAAKKPQLPITVFSLGDRVKIRHSNGRTGRVIELRCPLGPGGLAIYRVLIGRKPRIYVEVRADQLDLIPPSEKALSVTSEGDETALGLAAGIGEGEG